MAGLPVMQQRKMDAIRAANPSDGPQVHVKPTGATAVVSMVPDGERPRAPGARAPAPAEIDPNDFAVDPQPASPSASPAATGADPEPTPVIPAPRAGDEDLPKPKEGTPEYAYWLKWKTVAGMFERAKTDRREAQQALDTLTTRFDDLSRQITELRATPAPTATPAVVPPTRAFDSDLTEVERTTYQDALPVIEKMASRIVDARLEAAGLSHLKSEVGELKANTGAISKTQAQQNEETFIGRVRDRFPDMEQMIQKGIDDGTWTHYMESNVPYTGHTFKQALLSAHENRDLELVTKILKGYTPTTPPSIDELATPARRADTIDPVATAQRKPTLKWSERVKASDDFKKGRITRERLDQINALYTEAEKEGRINMNA